MLTPSISEFVPLRGLNMHFRHWGDNAAPKLFMVHGWMDTSASFQFMVDNLQKEWHVIAPDLRGFGLTEYPKVESYWYPDYIADVDAILNHFSPDEPVNLLGHSMGANVAMIYAGVCPERVKKVINLEGFGLPISQTKNAPIRMRQWLDELKSTPTLKHYTSEADVVARLQKTNPRLSDERAQFLAKTWSKQNEQGQWELLADPAHKLPSPLLYHADEVMECWKNITAPVLWMEASETEIWRLFGTKEVARAQIDERLQCIKQLQAEMIMDAGHMMHHDQPELLAQLIEVFLNN